MCEEKDTITKPITFGHVRLEPIIEFKTIEEAVSCLKEWQTRLFLDDWIIKLLLVDPGIVDGCYGTNEYDVRTKCCVIRLAIPNDDIRDRIGKH